MTDMRTFRQAVGSWAAGDTGAVPHELAARVPVRTAVLVEGLSDVAAVEAVAATHGRDLAAEGVCVLSMDGAMNIGRYARFLGPTGLGLDLTGLCDERERDWFSRGLERAGVPWSRRFFVCSADLEDELIRALGVTRVRELVEREGELRPLLTFLNQPAQRGRSPQEQLRRFLGTKKGRKIRYGHVLGEALGTDRVPAPLSGLLAGL
ncbi:TOPRIM nucleotidyl transferase/hydrolase domain-containing protein [Streptomyces sp. NPDC047973]|uniref:TOPRIM nucleotidyl transferase/hydrolase domain-containing protein n=1 Tax=Streptomyces sp. NPDC047973 TaxID=3155383 RepID=UPI00343C25AD